MALNGPVILKRRLEWDFGYATGFSSGSVKDMATSGNEVLYVDRSSSSVGVFAMSTVLQSSNVQEYFDGDHANFNDDSIWVYIPMLENDYTQGMISIDNQLGINLVVTIYDIVANNVFIGTNGPITQDMFYDHGTNSFTLATTETGKVALGPEGDDSNDNQLSFKPLGAAVVVRANPASDPGAGTYWSLGVSRAKV